MTTNQPSQTELSVTWSWKALIHAIETLVVQMNFTHVEAQAFLRFQKWFWVKMKGAYKIIIISELQKLERTI